MLQKIDNRYLILIALAVIVAVLPLIFPSSYYFRVASLVWVSALAAIGLNVLMGNAGQVSLGHAGFFGIGKLGGNGKSSFMELADRFTSRADAGKPGSTTV